MKHDLIICTRNRALDIEEALKSVAGQTRLPSTVIVVDASDDNATRLVINRWSEGRGAMKIRHLPANPSLPAQRNLGVSCSDADVVHFIDDDVVLEPKYFEHLVAVFERDAEGRVAGAGGLITNHPPRHPRMWWRLALLDSKRGGVVLTSGVNVVVAAAEVQMDVEWLSGCSMSFRSEVVRQFGFDESLSDYALMEDVDFSFRAARAGRLVLEPKARLLHNVSSAGRWDHRSRQRASTYRRGWFVAKNLPSWCAISFWWSVVAGALVQATLAVARRQRWGIRVALWRLEGGLDFFRGRR